MTEGNPLKLILMFSLPLLAGNLFQQAYNMVDTAIVGLYLGKEALAGVGASSSVQFMILGCVTGICAGFTIPVAQCFGAGDESKMRQYIYIASVTLVVMSIIVTTLCTFFCPSILRLITTPSDIFHEAYLYLVILFAGIPFLLFYNFLAGILRAAGDSKTPFYFLIFSTLLNLCLDLIFILKFKLGVAGAALATVISQASSGILTFIYIALKVEVLHPIKKERKWDNDKFRVLIFLGLPMGLQFSITAIGSMVLQTANNSLGSLYVAAFSAVTKLKQLIMSPCDAFGMATSTYAGQNFGAKKFDRLNKGIFWGTFISFSYALIASVVTFHFGKYMALMFVKSSETFVLDSITTYTHAIGCMFWAIGILNVVRPTIQSLGFSKRAMWSGIIEMIARCTVSFGFVPYYAFKAICWADPTAWLCAILYCIPTLLFVLKKEKARFPVKESDQIKEL